jgi:hypothetical protein
LKNKKLTNYKLQTLQSPQLEHGGQWSSTQFVLSHCIILHIGLFACFCCFLMQLWQCHEKGTCQRKQNETIMEHNDTTNTPRTFMTIKQTNKHDVLASAPRNCGARDGAVVLLTKSLVQLCIAQIRKNMTRSICVDNLSHSLSIGLLDKLA